MRPGYGCVPSHSAVRHALVPIALACLAALSPRPADAYKLLQAPSESYVCISTPVAAIPSGPDYGAGAMLYATEYGEVRAFYPFSGTFADFNYSTDFPLSGPPSSFFLSDLDGAGIRDLVATLQWGGDVLTVTTISTTSSTHNDYPLGAGPEHRAAAADLNHDGRRDLVATSSGGNIVSVFLNTGGGLMGPRADIATGSGPIGVAVADLDGDTHPDLIVAESGGDAVATWRGHGDGTFEFGARLTVGDGAASVAAADFDADGRLDVVCVSTGSRTATILKGNGDGSFSTAQQFATGSNPVAPVVGDFDLNGRPDVAVGSGSNIDVYLAQTGGSLASAGAVRGAFAIRSVAVGDADVDGRLDLIVANDSRQVTIHFGRPNGRFGIDLQWAVGSSPNAVALGDVTGDGWRDVLVANLNANALSFLRNLSGHGFTTATSIPTGLAPRDVEIGDINEDGRPDAVVSHYAANTVGVMLGDGGGGFTAGAVVSVAIGPEDLAIADVDGDANLDVVVSNRGANALSVLLGNGDGTLDPPIVTALPGSPQDVVVADFNRDGKPDVATVVTAPHFPVYNSDAVLMTGNGNGTFSSWLSLARIYATDLAVADVNRDGNPDVLAATEWSCGSVDCSDQTSVGVAIGPSFSEFGQTAAGVHPWAVAGGDVTGDGTDDVIAYNASTRTISAPGAATQFVSPNFGCPASGPGMMAAALATAPGNATLAVPPYHGGAVAVGDVTGDGRADVIVANADLNTISLLPTSIVTLDAPPMLLPATVVLRPSVPNPAIGGLTVRLALPAQGAADLRVYDLAGRHVATLWRGQLGAGENAIRWDRRTDAGGRAPAGVYFVSLRTAEASASQRIVLLGN